jgi:hypothetical protein
LWRASQGDEHFTALLSELVLPEAGERILQGNVSFTAGYLERVLQRARASGMGVALLHNHFTPGWQGMSDDDVDAERGRAARVLTATNLPLLGMTIATDEAWSARFWPRTAPRTYRRQWCETVRVVGQRLRVTYHPQLRPAPAWGEELTRTVSTWGDQAQADLMRLHIGVVGLGSVGRLVAEALARTGCQHVTFIDFDLVLRHNRDRLLGAGAKEAAARMLKVNLAQDGFMHASTCDSPRVRPVVQSVVEMPGLLAALNCDVLFSCVDRPWPRRLLNHLAYAHLIPVVDGGVLVRMRGDAFRGAEWSLRTAAPSRACLACAGAYDPALVEAERDDLLDDPGYLHGLDPDHPLRRNENVFPFCMSLAAHEVLQFIALATGLRNIPDFGDQRYHYNLGRMLSEVKRCRSECPYPSLVATGDAVYPRDTIVGFHHAAERARKESIIIPPAAPTMTAYRAPQAGLWGLIRRRIRASTGTLRRIFS